MKYGVVTVLVLVLVLVLTVGILSAGCVGVDSPVTEPLAGDPVLGEWIGNKQTTQIDSGTGDILKISENCKVRVSADGSGTLTYHSTKRGSSSFGHYEGDASYSLCGDVTVSKQDNVYTIGGSSEGTYVMTLSADGSAVLETPYGSMLLLHKSSSVLSQTPV
ncbi:MAG TPA: hypothetical protein O0Y06_07075 [Methanocorpusculum sp.]|nr:hypothetical protein [Methanocorpusculum sp.]HJK80646.1 hypothetical protein [Methanocorpusculum sp.]